jgi:thiol-disulfide isomerase/thioredoxin
MNNFKNFLNELEILIQKYKSILNNENNISNDSLSLFKDNNSNNIMSLFSDNNNSNNIMSLFNNNLDDNNLDDTLNLFKNEEDNNIEDNKEDNIEDILKLFQGDMKNNLNNLDNLFNNKKEELDNSTVLFFYNPRCPACIKTKPSWDIIVDNVNNYFKKNTKLFDISSIDVSNDSNESICRQFDIKYVPTFIIYDAMNKNIFVKKEGSLTMDQMISYLGNFYNFMNKIR